MAIEYSQVANPTINKSFRGQDINFKLNDAQLPSRSKAQVQMQVVKAPNQAALQARMNTPKLQMRNVFAHDVKYEKKSCCDDGSLDNIAYRNPNTQYDKSAKANMEALSNVMLDKGTCKLNYQTQDAMAIAKKIEAMKAKYNRDYAVEGNVGYSEAYEDY